MLSPYRVVDLTRGNADLGPMILADLGAEVVRVEPPGGGAARQAEPLAPGLDPGMASLRFHAFNRNKRSVTLDLDSEEGRARFLRLVAASDFLVEDMEPGEMAARGLGFDALRAVSPRLVYVAVTPFGQDGPYASYRATDLTLSAMGGMAALIGEGDRPPVRVSVPQAWLHAAAECAVAAMAGHWRRLATGEAQFVDVSVQCAVFWTGLQAMIAHAIQGRDFERSGSALQLGTITLPLVYPCSDGEIVLVANGPTMVPLVRWMVAEGVVPGEWVTLEDWPTYDVRVLSGQPTKLTYDEVMAAIARYTSRHSKQELLELGIPESVTIAPVTTVRDVLAFPQLESRAYWQPLALPGDGSVRSPGPFVRASKTPIRYRHPVPRPGEADASFDAFLERRPAAAAAPAGAPGALPFAGLRVADFSWIGVGPITAKYLADHGAEVVHIETANPPDRLRVGGPFKDGVFGPNRSQFFGAFNTSKRSVALNLKVPEAREAAKRLIAWADVIVESFTPGTMDRFGLGYEDVRRLNPGAIMVSTCLMGQTGPAASLAGYGYHAGAISGFYEVTGWPDRPPGGPWTAYTDTIAPRFLGAAVMAALDHRRRTGEGQYIEQGQLESALYFLAPELLDYQVSGAVPRRMGNRSPYAAPHGIYWCAGGDQWCAIAVESDEQWLALRRFLGSPAWAMDPALESLEGRLSQSAELDQRLDEATRTHDRYELMAALQAVGVPAGAVQRSSDLLRDPQLAHRNFFHPLEHAEMGLVPYEGHQFRISGYESGPRFPAPCLGEHSVEILTEIAGLGDDEIAALLAAGGMA